MGNFYRHLAILTGHTDCGELQQKELKNDTFGLVVNQLQNWCTYKPKTKIFLSLQTVPLTEWDDHVVHLLLSKYSIDRSQPSKTSFQGTSFNETSLNFQTFKRSTYLLNAFLYLTTIFREALNGLKQDKPCSYICMTRVS